jgi:hypothetical protein
MKLPSSIEASFAIAASELGFASAARLFVREVESVAGTEGIRALQESIGAAYPVLDAVAREVLEGLSVGADRIGAVVAALHGVERLLVVGIEADALDALVSALPQVNISILRLSTLAPRWDRVLANHPPRVIGVELDAIHTLAGRRSALLTFLYGHDGRHALVEPTWLRVAGPDVSPRFPVILGWNVLAQPLHLYPRYLAEQDLDLFSTVIG